MMKREGRGTCGLGRAAGYMSKRGGTHIQKQTHEEDEHLLLAELILSFSSGEQPWHKLLALTCCQRRLRWTLLLYFHTYISVSLQVFLFSTFVITKKHDS